MLTGVATGVPGTLSQPPPPPFLPKSLTHILSPFLHLTFRAETERPYDFDGISGFFS